MILVIHANMIALPRPTCSELMSYPFSTSLRYLIESIGIVGVDIFVLISGWFLINTRAKSFLSLCFKILFICGGIYLIMLITGQAEFSAKHVADVLLITPREWFVKAYFVLLVIAPVLNAFVSNSSEKQQRYLLIGFFVFSSTLGWIGGASRFFVSGYGPLLFIGLYLLAQYAHNTIKSADTPTQIRKLFNFDKKYDLLIFGICVAINTITGIVGLYRGINLYGLVYAYINPLNVLAALYLMLFFSKLKINTNKTINTLAAGSFAVFLIHTHIDINPWFNQGCQHIYTSYDNICCVLFIFIFLVFVYIISVATDIPRVWIWNKISNKYNIK